MNNSIVLEERFSNSYYNDRLETVIIDGFHISTMKDHFCRTRGVETTNHIITNAQNALPFFADPNKLNSTSKILCLGKVQSGKTAFFIASIALAFDNGYELCIIFGGTKNTLLDQNITRLKEDFDNNPKVKIIELRETCQKEVKDYLDNNFKVILIVLKNVSSPESNLYNLKMVTETLKFYKTLIVDDESDEHTPGAPRLKSKNNRAGITHDVIRDIYSSLVNVTMMFVTATPQANLLISTLDNLSPDHIVLVEPGEDYTGGDAFHDTMSNDHVQVIHDSDDFKLSIPETFKSALKFFLLGTALMSLNKDPNNYSMLVHPSGLTKVQKNIVEKIQEEMIDIQDILRNKKHLSYDSYRSDFFNIYRKSSLPKVDFDSLFNEIIRIVDTYQIYEFNTTESGKSDIEKQTKDKNVKYKIFVGGNMLGRGITIPNLCVTYMYRDSKVSAIDTLYQRARWFGYKRHYFELCRVYMTESLKEKFIAVADSERDLWNSVKEFLAVETDLKKFNRLFYLPHDKLILTRQSVSKTITFERVKPGFTYDKSVLFLEEHIAYNYELVQKLIHKYEHIAYERNFAVGDYQNHLIIETRFTSVFEDFLENYKFQRNSQFGLNTFKKINAQIYDGQLENEISVVIMRYKTNEFRSLTPQKYSIKELPQGYDNGTGYPGDKNLPGFENKLQLQIHLVYTNDKAKNIIYVLLAFNNPYTKQSIRYATGDQYYDTL